MLIIGNSGCCALCKIDTTVEYQIDTIYYPDTIQVRVVEPLIIRDTIPLHVVDTFKIYIDSLATATFDGGYIPYYNDSLTLMDDLVIFSKNDTSRVESNYAYSLMFREYDNVIHAIFDKDSIDVMIDSIAKIVITQENTIIKTRENSKKLKTYRRLTWGFGLILLLIVIYAVKPFVESLFSKRE